MDKKTIPSFEEINAVQKKMLKTRAGVVLTEDEDQTKWNAEKYNNMKKKLEENRKQIEEYKALQFRRCEENQELSRILKTRGENNSSTEITNLRLSKKLVSNVLDMQNENIKLIESCLETTINKKENDSDNTKMELDGNASGIFDTDLPSISGICNPKKIGHVYFEFASQDEKYTNYIQKDTINESVLDSDYPNTSGTLVIPKINIEENCEQETELDHQVIFKDKNYLDIPTEKNGKIDADYPNISSDN